MKKLKVLSIVCCFSMLFSISSFAAFYDIEIDGQAATAETFGDIEVIDPNVISSVSPMATPADFTFNITDKVETETIVNQYPKWKVQTQALVGKADGQGGYGDLNVKYVVSIRDRNNNSLFAYIGKCDNILGGVTFSNVPLNSGLHIRVEKEKNSVVPSGYRIRGEGTTQYLN